jgi:hypothetical protein
MRVGFMRDFLLNLFLPRFSKLDFFNLLVYGFWAFLWQPLAFLGTVFSHWSFVLVFALFVFFAYKFVFAGDATNKRFLYSAAGVLVGFAVFLEFLEGFFSFGTNSLWETFVAIFSVFVLLQAIVLLILVRARDSFGLGPEFEKRVSQEPLGDKTFFLGAAAATILFLALNLTGLIPHPLIGIPFLFKMDELVRPFEKIFWGN